MTRRTSADVSPGADLSHLFVPAGADLPNDFISVDDDEKENARTVDDARSDWAKEIDKDIPKENSKQEQEDNPAQSYDTEYKRSQRAPITAAVVRKAPHTLTGARVILKNATTSHEGTVVAEGKYEFCTKWRDGTVTLEEKQNFSLYH